MLRTFLLSFHLFLIFRSVLCGDCIPSDEKRSAEASLREKVFCNYNRNVRPVRYFSNQTVVKIEMYPLKIFLDEYEDRLTLYGKFHYVWQDDYLTWEPEEYENIPFLIVSPKDIWIPDITVNVPIGSQDLQKSDCLVSYAGRVMCLPMNTVTVSCAPNLVRYPFDVQNCTFRLLAPSYPGHHLDLDVLDRGVYMILYRPNKIWQVVSMTMVRGTIPHLFGNLTFYPFLNCNVVLQRHAGAHRAVIILPGLVLAGLTLMTFLMGDMHHTRVAVSGVTFLCNLMYCLYFGHQLPYNGDQVPLIVTFFRDSLAISGLAVIITALVHHIRRVTAPPSMWLSNLMGKLEISPFKKIFFFKESFSSGDDGIEIIQDAKKNPTTWCQLAAVIDRIVFFICSFIYIILYFFFMP